MTVSEFLEAAVHPPGIWLTIGLLILFWLWIIRLGIDLYYRATTYVSSGNNRRGTTRKVP